MNTTRIDVRLEDAVSAGFDTELGEQDVRVQEGVVHLSARCQLLRDPRHQKDKAGRWKATDPVEVCASCTKRIGDGPLETLLATLEVLDALERAGSGTYGAMVRLAEARSRLTNARGSAWDDELSCRSETVLAELKSALVDAQGGLMWAAAEMVVSEMNVIAMAAACTEFTDVFTAARGQKGALTKVCKAWKRSRGPGSAERAEMVVKAVRMLDVGAGDQAQVGGLSTVTLMVEKMFTVLDQRYAKKAGASHRGYVLLVYNTRHGAGKGWDERLRAAAAPYQLCAARRRWDEVLEVYCAPRPVAAWMELRLGQIEVLGPRLETDTSEVLDTFASLLVSEAGTDLGEPASALETARAL